MVEVAQLIFKRYNANTSRKGRFSDILLVIVEASSGRKEEDEKKSYPRRIAPKGVQRTLCRLGSFGYSK